MAIIRPPMSWDGLTPVPNQWMRDAGLSWKAKGLLANIVGHAPGYELTVRQLIEDGTDGKDAVLAGLRELEEAGYLERTRMRAADGTWGAYDYEVREPAAHQGGSNQGGKTRTGSDQEKEAVSAGQDQSGFSGADNPPTKKTTSKKTRENNSKTSSSRATRLDAQFQPTEEMRTWFREQSFGGTPQRWLEEHQRFVDYWIAKPGAAGLKLDWPATWRNWMRKAAETIGSRPPAGTGRKPFSTSAEKGDQRRSQAAEVARIADELAERYGTDPTDPIANQRIGREARKIYESRVNTCQPTGYSEPDMHGVLDAEWTENPPREVTAA